LHFEGYWVQIYSNIDGAYEMKKLMMSWISGCLAILVLSTCYADNANQIITTGMSQSAQEKITPEQALEKLKAGNKRFATGNMHQYNYKMIRKNTAKGQYPYAVILSCLDSRSAPDITFDQGLGDIFVGRVAGNVISDNMLGSMEFATEFGGAKLIVVMGHTDCGAIKGACARIGENNLGRLLSNIKPAVDTIDKNNNLDCNNPKTINAIAKQNVINQVNNIYYQSRKIRRLVNAHKVMLVGAMHNLATGKIDFFYTFKAKAAKASA